MSTPSDPDLPSPPPEGARELSADAVLDRMKEVYQVETDSALADCLHTTRQNISKWRSRNSVPYAEAVTASYVRATSIDYILTGREISNIAFVRSPDLDVQLLRAILLSLLSFDRIKIIGDDTVAELNNMAKAIAFQYKRAAKAGIELQHKEGLDAETARMVAVAATELLSSDGTMFGPRLQPTPKRDES